MPDDRIEILVARRVGTAAVVRLPDAARAVDECFVEPARVRLVRLLVAKMPFAENTARVTGLLEHLRQDGGLERHAFALEDGVRHAVFHRVPPGHQRAASWRTSGTDHEPREARAGVVQLVEVRRTNPRVPMPPDRPVALVVGDDEDDVGCLGLGLRLAQESTKRTEEHGNSSECRLHAQLINQPVCLANMGFTKALVFPLQALG